MELLVKALSTKILLILQFCEAVYYSILKRADAFLNLQNALTIFGHVGWLVGLLEKLPFQRYCVRIPDAGEV